MLNALEIHDLPVIDRLEIGFRPGLNVLTGETGAGKSIQREKSAKKNLRNRLIMKENLAGIADGFCLTHPDRSQR